MRDAAEARLVFTLGSEGGTTDRRRMGMADN